MAALKTADSYLWAARLVSVDLFDAACQQIAAVWRTEENWNAPSPGDIMAAANAIESRQRADLLAADFQRRMDEAKSNRMTPDDAKELLEKYEVEWGDTENQFRQRRLASMRHGLAVQEIPQPPRPKDTRDGNFPVSSGDVS